MDQRAQVDRDLHAIYIQHADEQDPQKRRELEEHVERIRDYAFDVNAAVAVSKHQVEVDEAQMDTLRKW